MLHRKKGTSREGRKKQKKTKLIAGHERIVVEIFRTSDDGSQNETPKAKTTDFDNRMMRKDIFIGKGLLRETHSPCPKFVKREQQQNREIEKFQKHFESEQQKEDYQHGNSTKTHQ